MKYKKGYKYQLVEDHVSETPIKPAKSIKTRFIELDTDGKLLKKAGYAWDGPSGPTVDTDNSMTPSLDHDAFAQLMRMKKLGQKWRIPSNLFFYKECLKRKMLKARAWLWKRSLDRFGGPSTNPKNAKKIYEVD